MRITTKGQVTIPADVREELGLLPNTEVRILRKGNVAVLEKIDRPSRRGDAVVASLKGKGNKKMTTGQIMALTRGD